MKKILVAAIILMCIANLSAQVRIGEEDAFSTAACFLKQNTRQQNPSLSLSEVICSKTTEQPNLYVFSNHPRGFIIVSALNEVLAYSLTSTFPTSDKLPEHIAYWLNLYNEQTDYLALNHGQIRSHAKNRQSVGPLITSIWGQGCFHNEACPFDTSGPCQHVSAGCLAIAMAQIMHYHKQPLIGHGSVTYQCGTYGDLTADFGQTTYQWELMADTVRESNLAVATLVSHCGISVNTSYGPHSSLATISTAVNAFQDYFGYSSATWLRREKYTDEAWSALIANDLDKGLPVHYAGTSNLGGHAFICDGYDSNGLFHFNFGWDGVADGYYTINDPSGFSTSQSAIIDIYHVNDLPISSDEHGIIYVSPDGTGDGSSWEQATSELQYAIFKSHSDGGTVWVKEGIYSNIPHGGYSFNIFGSCRLYGGFEGNEPYDFDLSLRNHEEHPSILDGNNKQGVILVNTESNNNYILIDGFTIQNGKASYGGGLYTNNDTHIKNCTFCFNHATNDGGAYSNYDPNYSVRASVFMENCEFYGNEARKNGGAISDSGNSSFLNCRFHDNSAKFSGGANINSGNTTYIGCQFHDNQAKKMGGALITNWGGESCLINCTFSNNTAAEEGGGIYNCSNNLYLWSCLINNNTALIGGGCYSYNVKSILMYNCTIVKNKALRNYGGVCYSYGLLRNCIIWGNESREGGPQVGVNYTYSYCAVQNDPTESGLNFDASEENDGNSPEFYIRFKNADVIAGAEGRGGDWRLLSNSLCINRGTTISNQPESDLDGNPRVMHGITDLGAYETDVTTQFINTYYCEEVPFYYQDSLISELGYYSFPYPANPYDSLVVIHFQPPPPIIYLQEKICENETYDFFGTTIEEPGVYTTTDNCFTYELDLTVKPLEPVFMEERICEGETYDFFGQLLHESGHYSTILDCKAYELDLNVSTTPMEFVATEEEICEGENYDFFGRIISHTGVYSTTIDCTTHILDLTVSPLPEIRCTNDTTCGYGNPVKLFAFGADTYLWSTGDTTQSITVFPMEDKTYTVCGFSRSGCSETRSINVRVVNDPDEMVLYPNPANDETRIFMPLIDEVEVFNLWGERVSHIMANREAVVLDLNALPSGIYVVHVRQMKKLYSKKLVVLH